MQEIFGSVRRSLVFRANPNGDEAASGGGGVGGIAEKIGFCLRKSRVGLGLGLGFLHKAPPVPPGPLIAAEVSAPPIRWRKGELIGCGAFGQVYMGMNLDSGELLAVKQVLIGNNNASREKAQRYLGTVREEETLNILLEFVPGGSISSLLGKFGSFPEAVIRMYTKQLLQGLEYLHHNGIIHRDIKGANILVDNKGCIKLADFGASKQVAKLATITAAKSMKGTPYWMAPEVIVQSGHSFSADIWSVGCTVIEMATGKPPWSQQYQEVAALFHVGTTKSHPPIPEHLSLEAKDFLLKCLQEEPNLRPSASDLLQHPFVTGEFQDLHPLYHSSVKEPSKTAVTSSKVQMNNLGLNNVKHVCDSGSTMNPEKALTARPMWEAGTDDEMCRFNDGDDFPVVSSSFNPMSEPFDDWPCKFDFSPEQGILNSDDLGMPTNGASGCGQEGENDFTFPCERVCEDNEVTETKIKAFLDEKALDMKKLQTPLYEEFYNSLNATNSQGVGRMCKENITNNSRLPPKNKSSPNKVINGASSPWADTMKNISHGNCSRRVSSSGEEDNEILREIPSPQLNEWGDLQAAQQEPTNLSASFSERRRKWKEELDQELERERVMMRQAGLVGKIFLKDSGLNQKKDHLPPSFT